MGKRGRSTTKEGSSDPPANATIAGTTVKSSSSSTTTTLSSSTSSSSSSSSSSLVSSRPKRQAMLQAKENIHHQIESERSSDIGTFLSSLPSSSSSSSSVHRGRTGSSSKYSNVTDRSGTVTPSKLASIPSNLLSFVPVESTGKIYFTPELYTAPLPTRNKDGELIFKDHPEFAPNLTPEEVLRKGSFGGYYYRPIASNVTGKIHYDYWREFPNEWFQGISIPRQIVSPIYDPVINTYKVSSGQDLREWEESNWITEQDPYGWFQWYCRFYLGRRSEDDERQISRWIGVAGANGRWKNNLIAKCVQQQRTFDDVTVSPVVRQTLQHWGYVLTQKHYDDYAKKLRKGNQGTAFIPRKL